jgi:hypothetical protein
MAKKSPLPWFAYCEHCPSQQAPEARRSRTGGPVVWVCPACGGARRPIEAGRTTRPTARPA